MRVVVLGGTGNFGARIVRALQDDPGIELVAAGRRVRAVSGAEQVRVASVDLGAEDFEVQLKSLAPEVVVHTVGPFQQQGYRVAASTLACGANYLDLADGRGFVTGFVPAVHEDAVQAGRVAICGASTLPALSSAVVDALVNDGLEPDTLEVAIAPGQRAPRGAATLQAVFSYLGRPVRILEQGRWISRTGWMDIRRVPLAFGTRWGAACDVPDLALFPERYPSAQTVRFHAALEMKVQHAVLWMLAALVRAGVPLPVVRWCAALDRMASVMDRYGGEWGGMRVSVVGSKNGQRLRRTWQLTAPAVDGPEIPCMAAISLLRRLARGETFPPGARVCMGMLPLAEFQPQFDRWGIRTRIHEEAA
jgi:saccharopine dehydrogenase-like NADP-dependent oxidoreductase